MAAAALGSTPDLSDRPLHPDVEAARRLIAGWEPSSADAIGRRRVLEAVDGPDRSHRRTVPDRRRRLLILGICSMSLLIVGLDTTIVNVALPGDPPRLHSSLSGLQWTIDAYTLVLASLLMLAGSTADRLGRRRVFQLGLVVFSLGSLLCALAPSLRAADRRARRCRRSAARCSTRWRCRSSATCSRIRASALRRSASGARMIGISMALGPGASAARWSTRSAGAPVFLVNVPVGLVAIVLTALFVPESRAPHPRRFDPVGQVLVIVALATLTYAIIEGPSNGWLSAQTLGPVRGLAGRVRAP